MPGDQDVLINKNSLEWWMQECMRRGEKLSAVTAELALEKEKVRQWEQGFKGLAGQAKVWAEDAANWKTLCGAMATVLKEWLKQTYLWSSGTVTSKHYLGLQGVKASTEQIVAAHEAKGG